MKSLHRSGGRGPLGSLQYGRAALALMFIAWAAALLPALLALSLMLTHWVPVPWWDEWKTPGEQIASWYRGTLNFAELCSQHNESRKLFPRLVYLPVAIGFGWDVRSIMAGSFALVCGGSALLYRLARRTCASSPVALWCFAAMNAWLFWPRQHENFLLSIQGELFVPAFSVVAACLMNLSSRPLWQKAVANAAFALVSTYSVANGMLVWLLAFPFDVPPATEKERSSRAFCWIGYGAAGLISIACYFRGYEHPALAPQMVFSVQRAPELFSFLAQWLGDIVLVAPPFWAGTMAALVFIALALMAVVQRPGATRLCCYPWLVLGAYTLISGCATAVGRLGFGIEAAAHVRYAPFTAFLYIAIIGLSATLRQRLRENAAAARAWRIVCVVGGILLVGGWLLAFKQERRLVAATKTQREALLLTMRWGDAIPENPDFALLSPYEETPDVIHTIAAHGTLRPALVPAALAEAVSQRPNAIDDSSGALEEVRRASTGVFIIRGWARVPDENRAADCIVLGYTTADGVWHLWNVAPTGIARRDIALRLTSDELRRCGFKRRISPTDILPLPITFQAWAIDLKGARAFPMAGAIPSP